MGDTGSLGPRNGATILWSYINDSINCVSINSINSIKNWYTKGHSDVNAQTLALPPEAAEAEERCEYFGLKSLSLRWLSVNALSYWSSKSPSVGVPVSSTWNVFVTTLLSFSPSLQEGNKKTQRIVKYHRESRHVNITHRRYQGKSQKAKCYAMPPRAKATDKNQGLYLSSEPNETRSLTSRNHVSSWCTFSAHAVVQVTSKLKLLVCRSIYSELIQYYCKINSMGYELWILTP